MSPSKRRSYLYYDRAGFSLYEEIISACAIYLKFDLVSPKTQVFLDFIAETNDKLIWSVIYGIKDCILTLEQNLILFK